MHVFTINEMFQNNELIQGYTILRNPNIAFLGKNPYFLFRYPAAEKESRNSFFKENLDLWKFFF